MERIKSLSMQNTAVILIDFQNDFMELYKGSLAVHKTDQHYSDLINQTTKVLTQRSYKLFVSFDNHSKDHISFASAHQNKNPFEKIKVNGVELTLWPDHCVAETSGAKIKLNSDIPFTSIEKGFNKDHEGYSVFADEDFRNKKFASQLKKLWFYSSFIFGLATDFCVKQSVLDALSLGFEVTVVEDLCRAVNEEQSKQALIEMKGAEHLS